MRAKRTPPMLARGLYQLLPPFNDPSVSGFRQGMIYTNEAIRAFPDFTKKGIDPYTTFYRPAGLVNGQVIGSSSVIFQFSDEVAVDANIISLVGADGSVVYVPDTFIESYPSMPNQPFATIILSMSIGPIPDAQDLSNLKTSIANLVRNMIGVTVIVNENRAPLLDQPSNEEAGILETARNAAIVTVETDLSQRLAAEAQGTILEGQTQAITSILQGHNLLPH